MTEDVWEPELSLGREWAILELVARGYATEHERTRLDHLFMSARLDTAELLEQAMRHKLTPRLADYLEQSGHMKTLAAGVRYELRSSLGANRQRTTLLRREAARVAAALRAANVPFACTKGIALESTVFAASGVRVMFDVDFMIRPRDGQIVTDLLKSLGFRAGRYDWRTRTVVPLDRRTELLYAMSRDHLPHFVRTLQDDLVPFVSLDVATSLTWEHSPWQVPVEDCLRHVQWQRLPDLPQEIPTLSSVHHFIFLVLHLFREAWHERSIRANGDVNLAKFSDVLHAYRSWSASLGGLNGELQKYSLEPPVSWVITHLDRVLGTDLMRRLDLSAVDDAWLSAAQTPSGKVRWRGTMRDRLHSRDRAALLEPTPFALPAQSGAERAG